MIDKPMTNQRRKWEKVPRDREPGRWASLYAAMYGDGTITLSKRTFEALGEPNACVLLYDRETHVVGLRPASPAIEKDAYPIHAKGKFGGRRVFGHRLIRDFGIYLPETVRFPRCLIDRDGTLILDLKDVRPAMMKKRDSDYDY